MTFDGASDEEAAGEPQAGPGTDGGVASDPVTLASLARSIDALARRIGDLEDAVAEAVEEIGKTRRGVSELKHSAATRKQVKKLKKALDQLEVVEVGPGALENEK